MAYWLESLPARFEPRTFQVPVYQLSCADWIIYCTLFCCKHNSVLQRGPSVNKLVLVPPICQTISLHTPGKLLIPVPPQTSICGVHTHLWPTYPINLSAMFFCRKTSLRMIVILKVVITISPGTEPARKPPDHRKISIFEPYFYAQN